MFDAEFGYVRNNLHKSTVQEIVLSSQLINPDILITSTYIFLIIVHTSNM